MTAKPQTINAPVLPEARMHLVKPTSPVRARVVRNEICTASTKSAGFVRHIEFDVSGTPLAGAFLAGQSFGVIPPGVDERGRRHKVRLYSLACPSSGEDGQGAVVSTTVKRTIDEHWDDHRLFLGVASNYLCDRQVGEEVELSGPNGRRFLLPADRGAHDYIFFATGTGVAPFRGMTLELLSQDVGSRVVLVMGAPYATDLLYHDQFTELARTHERFHYLTAISRHEGLEGEPPMYVQQRLRTHEDLLRPLLESERSLVYICGVAGMEVGVLAELVRTLAPQHHEQFVQADAQTLAQPRAWRPSDVGRSVRTTERVFIEVY